MDKQHVDLTRRRLMQGSAGLAAAPFVATLGMMTARSAEAQTCERFTGMIDSPYGPVAPVADQATGLELLLLPAGFSYKSFGWTGDPMSNGQPCPGSHDGMAVVQQRRVGRSTELILIRNHEIGNSTTRRLATPGVPTYDAVLSGSGPAGGTTALVLRDGNLVDMYPTLAGTLTNCAGGPTPWGTWLSCEENTTTRAGIPHGYVFDVDPDPASTSGRPLRDMGRFRHEAVAVDPATMDAYQTEDASPVSALYRFVPNNATGTVGAYEDGGVLAAARIRHIVSGSASDVIQANQIAFASPCFGDEYEIEWVELPMPDAEPTTVNVLGTNRAVSGPFAQAWALGCARMLRGEGIWYHAGKVYVVDTAAGGDGAVWELTLETQRIRCIYVSSTQLAGNNVDNIAVSPRGGILCCEDGGQSPDPFGNGSRLFALAADGRPYLFAKNNVVFSAAQAAAAGKSQGNTNQLGSEFCGACWDPSGRILFVNIQSPGITFAITGPWAKGNL
ncbi:MAG: PhoX family protein [Rhodocyclaceae bacterium]